VDVTDNSPKTGGLFNAEYLIVDLGIPTVRFM